MKKTHKAAFAFSLAAACLAGCTAQPEKEHKFSLQCTYPGQTELIVNGVITGVVQPEVKKENGQLVLAAQRGWTQQTMPLQGVPVDAVCTIKKIPQIPSPQ